MRLYLLEMRIVEESKGEYLIEIAGQEGRCHISFAPDSKTLKYIDNNLLSSLLKRNQYQLRKILHNKKRDSFFVGFSLKFSLWDGKDMEGFNDMSKIVILDKRSKTYERYVTDKGIEPIHELFIDGCFLEKKGIGGYVVLHKNLNGGYKMFQERVKGSGSSQMELMAAVKGVELLKDEEKIRIITDSLYVRKGLTEWIINWRLNDWHTASGKKVKNIELWEKFDSITEGKYIEFKWVKGHRGHFENTICDLYAREATGE